MSGVILSHSRLMGGLAVVYGTRISVEMILRKLAMGRSEEQVLKDYPGLTRADVRAALLFAAECMADLGRLE